MPLLDSVARDLRFAARLMRRTPLVSAIALLSLALGIGANVAMFSLVNALMLKTLPIHAPEQLVFLGQPATEPERPPSTSFTNPQWEHLRDHQAFLTGVAAQGGARFDLNAGGESRPAVGHYVSGRYFDVLGVTPYMGRFFTERDDRRGGGDEGPVAVLSYGFWQREFGGDPQALGRTLSLDGHAFTIVGVAPPEFYGLDVGRTFDVAVPIGTESLIRGAESGLDRRSFWWLRLIGRMAPGQRVEQAQAQLAAFLPSLREATRPENYRPQDQERYLSQLVLLPGETGLSSLRTRYSRPLFVLLGIVSLVLLIACANMANLLLAQSAARQRELAVRLSLGASRWQVARQLLLESLLLSSLGAAAGVVLAFWGSRALVALISTRTSIVTLDLALDWRVLAFTAAVAIVTGLLFGVAPALRATGVAPAATLRDHSRSLVAGGRLNVGHGLVALQVAVSFVLVLGAGLFVRTLVDLTTQEMGFQYDRVLLASVDLRRTGAVDTERPALFERLREAVAAAPGVEGAAVSVLTPISNSVWNNSITVPGFEGTDAERTAHFNRVTPGYFRVMGTPILAGRDLRVDDRLGTPMVAVVNEAFARRFFRGESPLGKTFYMGTPGRPDHQEFRIVGLVRDAKYQTLREPAPPTMYTAWAQADRGMPFAQISMRVSGAATAFGPTALAAMQRVHQDVSVDFRAFEEDIRAAALQERLVASLSAFFGSLALLLAAMGLYGMMSYSVARRRNEIGIRVALGAEPTRVMSLVLAHVAAVTAGGLAVGLLIALGAGRFVETLLFGLVPADRTMMMLAALTLTIAAAVAGYLPARRAARIDPMSALRES